MEDIKAVDQKLFWKEAAHPGRLIFSTAAMYLIWGPLYWADMSMSFVMGLAYAVLAGHALVSYRASVRKRFINRRFEAHWNSLKERLDLFDQVMQRVHKKHLAGIHELPRNVHSVARSLYVALRRADLITQEVSLTERGLYAQPPSWNPPAHDAQAKELYRIADKNIAEYQHHFAGVMAGVQRTEAQTAVFITTVDTLRMKILGYRLAGAAPELNSQDFLAAMQEAKMQLAAIDQALEELELTPFPKTIAVMPPEPRTDANSEATQTLDQES
ncbi:MAG: hypothetical protein KJZ62_10655 [Fimbriimonadaceae bacterium]|nr:hypothetical protein [Fimbriimonadaceae bacterium]MCL4285547.1 hypothetical protein [Fimbriimonadaceae bacterium]MCZ7581738.1 hypothetical protein [Fimbriimonadaceae bacterium]QOJ10879.1 MAG: hypothetical protein HRU74_02015 [Chthonomonadaceae bacterium]